MTLQALSWWTLPDPMGPQERRVLVAAWDPFGAEDPGQGILDLETGAFTLVASEIVPMAWGPEGAFVFYLDSGRLLAFDVETGRAIDVVPDLARIEAFTWRPTAPAG